MEVLSAFTDNLLGLSVDKAEGLSTLQVCVRAVVVYVVLIAYVRFAKKRFLSEATAFDAILVIIIGSIASRAISGTAPFVPSLAGTFVLILFHWVASYFSSNSPTLSYLIKGRDTPLIKNGRVNHRALTASHMSMDDLEEDLRQAGVENISDVKSARLERAGKVSVIRK
jgi:uncharacterized membrane protein YcaP (DUF421 family)